MKKFLSLIVLLAVGAVAYSQTMGLKGGLNFASLGGDASGVETKIGFHAGIFVIIKTSEKFGVHPELVFSRQGAQLSQNSKFKINYDYVNLPVMLTAYPAEKFFLQAGPQVGFLVGAHFTDGNDKVDVKDQLNTVDFGIGLGAGYTTDSVIFGLRYNLGLSTTSKSSDGSFPNRVLQLSLGFRFNNF
jgi:hypothetical protein